MSLEKAIVYGKEHRKAYRGSKRFDHSCRNHGSCSYCESNRTHATKKAAAKVSDQEDEYFGYWSVPDPSDVDNDVVDAALEKMGIDPWDFEARRELDV
jgi:hypothetical protein